MGARLEPSGKQAIGVALDGSDETAVKAIVGLAKSKFGRVDGFHANFALVADGLLQEGLEIPLQAVDHMLRVKFARVSPRHDPDAAFAL